MVLSNCHTHTNYCDGKNTARDMVEAAIEKGFVSLGFSGHSPMSFPNDWGMKVPDLGSYINEIRSLKKEYAEKIDIICGIELDGDYVGVNLEDYDYVIASVHQLTCGNRIYSLDLSPVELTACVNEGFDGSWNKMAKAYFDSLADHVLSGNFDIVGHFDLITKFNGKDPLFDENDAEYQSCALKALDRIIEGKPEIIFEVNTGAMYRKGNPTPYPASFILEHIADKGGKITITSDAHCCEALDFAFDRTVQYCRSCGFREGYYLTSEGFKKTAL